MSTELSISHRECQAALVVLQDMGREVRADLMRLRVAVEGLEQRAKACGLHALKDSFDEAQRRALTIPKQADPDQARELQQEILSEWAAWDWPTWATSAHSMEWEARLRHLADHLRRDLDAWAADDDGLGERIEPLYSFALAALEGLSNEAADDFDHQTGWAGARGEPHPVKRFRTECQRVIEAARRTALHEAAEHLEGCTC